MAAISSCVLHDKHGIYVLLYDAKIHNVARRFAIENMCVGMPDVVHRIGLDERTFIHTLPGAYCGEDRNDWTSSTISDMIYDEHSYILKEAHNDSTFIVLDWSDIIPVIRRIESSMSYDLIPDHKIYQRTSEILNEFSTLMLDSREILWNTCSRMVVLCPYVNGPIAVNVSKYCSPAVYTPHITMFDNTLIQNSNVVISLTESILQSSSLDMTVNYVKNESTGAMVMVDPDDYKEV